MIGVSVKAREVSFKNKTFRLEAGAPFRIDFHDARPAGPGRDGRLSLDCGRVRDFEFLGRARTRAGAHLGLLRFGGEGGTMLAFNAQLGRQEPPVGNTRLGFEDLSASLPLDLPCLVAGTRVRTPSGPVAVENLQPGDLVLGRGGKTVAVRNIIHRPIDPAESAFDSEARPVVVLADSFAPGIPSRDLRLSRRQRVMVCGWRADRMTEFRGTLAPIGCLVDGQTIFHDTGSSPASYVHLVLEDEAVLLAEGLPIEGMTPDGAPSRGYRPITEPELMSLRPAVGAATLSEIGHAARPALLSWEISAMEREGQLGSWASALRLITVPPSSFEREEPLLLTPELADGLPGAPQIGAIRQAALHRG